MFAAKTAILNSYARQKTKDKEDLKNSLKPKDIPGLKKEVPVHSKRMSQDEFQNKIDEMHREMDLTLDDDDAELNDSIENYEGGNRTSRLANVSITARLSLNK